MAIIPGQKHKPWDGAPNMDTSSQGDTEDKVRKKKRKMINLDVMYMGSSDMEGTPKRKKCKVNGENQDVESDPMIPKRKKSGDGYIENPSDRETYTKKKRKEESHQDDAVSSSMVLHQEHNKKHKNAHKAKDSMRLNGDEIFTEEIPCRENTDLEGRSKERRKKKKTKKDCEERLLDSSLVEDLSSVHTHHTHKKKGKRKDGGDLQGEGFTEEVDERVDQSETAVKKKKKKRKEESHQEIDDIAANDASSSIVLYLEENEKMQKSRKAKDPKRHHGDEHLIEETTYRKLTDPEVRPEKIKKKPEKNHGEQGLDDSLVEKSLVVDKLHAKKKKKPKGGRDLQEDGFTEELFSQKKSPDGKETSEEVDDSVDQSETAVRKKKKKDEPHQETDDIAADNGSPSIVRHDEKNEKIKKSHKAKDPKRLHGYECFVEETPYNRLTDQDGRSEKRRKPKKDHGEKHLDHSLVVELSSVDIKHTKRKEKKWKGGGDLREDGVTEELFSQRKSPEGKETSEEVDDSVDQSETAVRKKRKRKEKSHQETGDIAANDGAIASIVLNGEQKEKIKKSKAKGQKGRHGDEGLYREPTHIKDKQSLKKKKKKKKDRLIENSSVEEVFISETQHGKKKKNQKGGGGLQDEGSTEELSSHRKSPDGSDAPEQVDESLNQVEKPKKKKKKRKDESHREDIAVDEPSYSELNDTEDRPGQTKEKRSKKVHLECPMEDSILEELLSHFAHDGFTATTEQVVETVDQAEVHVKKKAKTKKPLDRREETSGIVAEETLQSRAVESNGNVEGDSENTDQTSTSGRSRPQTCESTDTDQNQTTQDNRSTTSSKNTKASVKRRNVKMPFAREQDIALIKEYYPTIKEGSLRMMIALNQDLERVRNAKQKGIKFRSGQFTKEEDELIKENVEKFMSQVGINSPVMLFHPYYFPEQSRTICLLKRKYSFSQRIAEGLYRFCDSVLLRGAKLFHFAENAGRFTEQEKRQLQMYQELYGDDYITISKLMSRTVSSSKSKISEMSQEVNTGPWSIEETNLLITAVKEFVLDSLRKGNSSKEEPVTIPKRKLYKHIKWEQIYKKVGTRNWTHCKAHWSNIIMRRMNDGLHPLKGDLQKLTSMKMIRWLHDAKVRDYGDVKWDKLCDDIGNVTSFYAQLNLIRLKEGIDGWKNMRLHKIVDHLYNVTLPKLEILVSAATIPEPEIKEEFLISKMFREYTEDDEM